MYVTIAEYQPTSVYMKLLLYCKKLVPFAAIDAYQSNNLEYTVFAKASRLSAADSGSRGFVILPSGVTITRLHKESSRAFTSHLKEIIALVGNSPIE